MHIKPRHDFRPCVPGAFTGGLSRTSYFDGMVLSEADMLREQTYWATKRKLTNRALGSGIVWGLNMTWDEKQRCFTLCPGYGLSCCGDDLVVECPETVCEDDLIDPCSEEFRCLFADQADPCEDDCDRDPKAPVEACLYLEYVECPEDPRQVFEDPCAETPRGCRFGAIRETTRLKLVPPPPAPSPGPIERFCTKIEEIRQELSANGVELPDTHVAAGTTSAGIAIGASVGEARYATETGRIDLSAEKEAQLSLSSISGDIVTFRITPPPGYMITRIERDGTDVADMSTLMGADFKRTVSELSAGVGISEDAVIEFSPLMGLGNARVAAFNVAARIDAGTAGMTATIRDVSETPRRKDCLSHFANGIRLATGDASCTLRTLTLAVLTGWFRGMLGTPACCPEDADEPNRARLVLAWLVAWVAWIVLFGFDIRDERARGVLRCLQKLFAWWCDGMHYKGPVCDCDAHGIYLGCVKVSPKGKIICFDEWKHRRYVLTGPLVTHWGSQFGLAPLDVTATRLAGWICCVAGTDLTRPEEGTLAALGPRIDMLAASFATYGQSAQSGTIGGSEIASSRDVGSLEFIDCVIRQFQTNDQVQPQDVAAYDVVTSRALGLEMAVPSSGRSMLRELHRQHSVSNEILAAKLAEMPPMARAPASDFVDEVAGRISLSELKLPTANTVFTPLVEALDSADIVSVSDLILTGPEAAISKARQAIGASAELSEAGAAEIAMNHVFKAAQSTITATSDSIADEAAGRSDDDPFVRANLKDAGTLAAVRRALNRTLRGRGLNAAALREMAADVVAQQP